MKSLVLIVRSENLFVMATSKNNLKSKNESAKNYNAFKTFGGKQYTGMKVGRSHKWYYDKGEWRETKITPDLWEVHFEVMKRRAGHAPKGSGVPTGTEYHWYIMAHQDVKKMNEDDYTTELTGIKLKLGHKRAAKEKWSSSVKAQRKKLVRFLKEYIDKLENDPIPLEIEYEGEELKGEGVPISQTCTEKRCYELEITLNNEHLGIIHCTPKGWKMKYVEDKKTGEGDWGRSFVLV